MVGRSPHQVLSPTHQMKLDKEQIELMLREHNLDENIDLVYKLIQACHGDKHIDECVERIVKEFDEQKNVNHSSEDRYSKH